MLANMLGSSLQLYLHNKYDTPDKMCALAANLDKFFARLHGPSMMWKLPFEAKTVPCDTMPVLFLPLSRLSIAADASIKGPTASRATG